MLNRAIEIRRALHQIPEAGLCEHKTKAAVVAYLKELGATLYEEVFETGIVAYFDFVPGAPAIAFRADMDALSITEVNAHSFVSTHPGMMHACGHDGHMTMLILLAEHLTQNPLRSEERRVGKECR